MCRFRQREIDCEVLLNRLEGIGEVKMGKSVLLPANSTFVASTLEASFPAPSEHVNRMEYNEPINKSSAGDTVSTSDDLLTSSLK
jgi:hypothetical protein